VVCENILILPTPWVVIGNSEGMGVSKAKIFKGRFEAKLAFLEGWGGNFKPKNHSTF